MKRLFCFGFGYCAAALARRLQPLGWSVAGTSRDPARRLAMAQAGVEAFDFPLAKPDRALAGASHILAAVPPDSAGDPVLAAHGRDIAGRHDLAWFGYLSTTGVYGDRGGAWVDETLALAPSGERGRRRAAAERAWAACDLPLHVFRLPGIYGPGRSPLQGVRDGTARRIERPGQVFSRIHVDDLATVLLASMTRARPGAVYNVADDEPAAPADVVAYAARLLDLPLPPRVTFDEAPLSATARSFWAESKRVSNRLVKAELGITLAYPSYREGLAALVRLSA